MPRTGVSVLRDELEALNTWVETPPGGRTRRSGDTSAGEDGGAVRARSAAAFRERRATSRVEATPRPVRAGDTARASRPPRAGDTAGASHPSGAVGAVRAPSAEAREAAARLTATIYPSASEGPTSHSPGSNAAIARRSPDPSPANVATRGDKPQATRRTVTIRGQVADRYSTTSRRRPDLPRHERPGFKPDRVAMWAVLLGIILVLVAATSAHAARVVH